MELHASKKEILAAAAASHAAVRRGADALSAEFSNRAIYLLAFLGNYATARDFGFLSRQCSGTCP